MIFTTVCLLAGMLYGEGDDAQMRILQLARSGRNTEAIQVYEALPDRDQAGIDVLRAAAGCYWRERQFEEARMLYRVIMARQSDLNTIADGGQDRALSAPDAESSAPQVPVVVEPEKGAPESAAVAEDLAALKEQYEGLQAQRESQRLKAEARIAELTAAAVQRSGDLETLRTRLEAQSAQTSAAELLAVQERQAVESRAAALQQRIASLEQDVAKARMAYATLTDETDNKMNDLLDAIEAERLNREQAEAALLATADALESQKAASESANLQVTMLEQTLDQLRGQFDEVSAKLAVRNLDVAQEIDRVDHASLELALDEIERLEQEQAAGDSEAARQQARLLEHIAALEMQAADAGEALATVRQELDDERRQRFDLEAQAQQQAAALAETAAMLDEAKAALARQYDALREHVQGGTTILLEPGATPVTVESEVLLSPDLVPMIDQLEVATATAVSEVKALRERLERERAAFAAAAAEKEAEIEGLRQAMAERDRTIGMLEADLQAERTSTARVLAMARETEAALTAHIRELETIISLSRADDAGADSADGDNGVQRNEAVFDSILEMASADKTAAIARFETLPEDAEIPSAVLRLVGNLYREQGSYPEALALFEKLVARHPDDLYAERKLVMTLFDMDLYDQALDRLVGPGGAAADPQ